MEIVQAQSQHFKSLIDMYEERDENTWTLQKNETLFKQWGTTLHGLNLVMQKMRVTLRASIRAVIDTTVDYDRR